MIPNLRDVGESINLIHGQDTLQVGLLFRGGSVNGLFSKDELPDIKTIINLRKGPDQEFEGIKNIHIPATDTLDNYFTEENRIQVWVNQVLLAVTTCDNWPILIHCTAGKDRTGVIIAVILKAIGVEDKEIEEDYLFSEGIPGTKHIEITLNGIKDIKTYIQNSEIINKLKKKLLL